MLAADYLAPFVEAGYDPTSSKDRREWTADDPVLFALTYLAHHFEVGTTAPSLSPVHLAWAAEGETWAERTDERQQPHRRCYVAPRGMGKSTWWFLVLPMWAAAHGHAGFVAAFADAATQAEEHLATFRRELQTNAYLLADFERLATPARKPGTGATEGDRRGMYLAESGFVFLARGLDSSNLGMKVGARRPDLIILDDVEPGEDGYSALQAKKRRKTILDVVLPINVYARVVLVGTVTMPGSIVHQLVEHAAALKAGEQPAAELAWIDDEGFVTRHDRPFDEADESVWPERWSTDYLASIRHTASFAKNFENDPVGSEGGYWTVEDFVYGEVEPEATTAVLTVDPAVTTKKSSDYTGLAVVAYARSGVRRAGVRERPREVEVRRVWSIKGDATAIRAEVVKAIEADPQIAVVVVESNQGGDLWLSVLKGLPVPVKLRPSVKSKEARAARALVHYREGRVKHRAPFRAAEEQMITFPNAPNDDMVDAVGAGVCGILDPVAVKRTGAEQVSYVA